jgi:prepilin-type N-terminal cleavage/methylation domain-containing protein
MMSHERTAANFSLACEGGARGGGPGAASHIGNAMSCTPITAVHPRPANAHGRRRGFTLIELLVVILIILLVSAVTLPVVIPAMSHRQVSEAARILQAALAGARDSALRTGAPSGIRLLPDPAFPLTYSIAANNTFGQILPNIPLAANRIIPIEAAPEYSEGAVNVINPAGAQFGAFSTIPPYPTANGGGVYPVFNAVPGANVLMVEESVVYLGPNGMQLNEPTSWFWNIRVGDQIQLNGAGLWYTVVGPMTITPQPTTIGGVTYANPEMFVNVGPPGTQSPWSNLQGWSTAAPTGVNVSPEFLFLVNGVDDNKNGLIDEGFDGVNNNPATNAFIDDLGEWEPESWSSASIVPSLTSPPPPPNLYTIQRRPAPASNSRETALPTNVVIDLTTWNYPATFSTVNTAVQAERSQLPPGVINPYTGYVDILVYPNGTVVPTTIYSTPSSFGMAGAYFHFWLAERADVVAPGVPGINPGPPYLPIGTVSPILNPGAIPPGFNRIQGEYRVVTLFTRTGQVTTNDNAEFDNPIPPNFANGARYNPLFPFLAAQQGARGGH